MNRRNRVYFWRRRTRTGWSFSIQEGKTMRIVALADRKEYSPELNRVTVWGITILDGSGMKFEAPSLNDAEDYLRRIL